MTSVHFERYNFSISSNEIFDIARKKRVSLTPEESVRQTILHYLVYSQHIALKLIAVERKIEINHQTKRFDIAVYNRKGQPFILVECKSPEVPISIDTLLQSAHYNELLSAEFVWLSNGRTNYFFDVKKRQLLPEIPELKALL